MLELLPDFLREIVSTTMNVVLMMSLLQPKYGKLVTRLTMLGILTVDLGTAFYCYLSGNLTMLARIDTVLFAALCFVIKPLFKDTFMQWLFSYITIQNITDAVVIISFVGSRRLPYPAYANVAIRLVLFLIFYFLMRYKVRPLYRQLVERWNVFFYVALSVWITYTYVVVTADDIVVTLTQLSAPLMFITLIAFTAYVSVCHALSTLSRENALREDKLRADNRQEILQSELASQEDFVRMAKQSRHDLRHHNALLADYLDRGDIDGAKEYLLQYDAHITDMALEQYCKNSVANGVMRLYAHRAQSSNTAFTICADIPEKLPLDAAETCELFSNLLENACEACENVSGKRFISLLSQTDDILRLELRNSVEKATVFDENGLPLTTKANGGVGTKSALSIITNHGGILKFSQENDVFTAQIILPLR